MQSLREDDIAVADAVPGHGGGRAEVCHETGLCFVDQNELQYAGYHVVHQVRATAVAVHPARPAVPHGQLGAAPSVRKVVVIPDPEAPGTAGEDVGSKARRRAGAEDGVGQTRCVGKCPVAHGLQGAAYRKLLQGGTAVKRMGPDGFHRSRKDELCNRAVPESPVANAGDPAGQDCGSDGGCVLIPGGRIVGAVVVEHGACAFNAQSPKIRIELPGEIAAAILSGNDFHGKTQPGAIV